MLTFCVITAFFACNMLMPMSVNAAQNACPPHTFSATHEGSEIDFLYSHQYLIENGEQGPVWGSCRVDKEYRVLYLSSSKQIFYVAIYQWYTNHFILAVYNIALTLKTSSFFVISMLPLWASIILFTFFKPRPRCFFLAGVAIGWDPCVFLLSISLGR